MSDGQCPCPSPLCWGSEPGTGSLVSTSRVAKTSPTWDGYHSGDARFSEQSLHIKLNCPFPLGAAFRLRSRNVNKPYHFPYISSFPGYISPIYPTISHLSQLPNSHFVDRSHCSRPEDKFGWSDFVPWSNFNRTWKTPICRDFQVEVANPMANNVGLLEGIYQ